MSAKNVHAGKEFQASLERVSGVLDDPDRRFPATGRRSKIAFLGERLVASQLGAFAAELTALVDEVEMQMVNEDKAVIRRELVVPDAALEAFGTTYLKSDGAMTSTSGRKDNNLLDTYRIPVVLDVAALKDAEAFVTEMRELIDALYIEGKETLDKIG
jgi:hypothetical protein